MTLLVPRMPCGRTIHWCPKLDLQKFQPLQTRGWTEQERRWNIRLLALQAENPGGSVRSLLQPGTSLGVDVELFSDPRKQGRRSLAAGESASSYRLEDSLEAKTGPARHPCRTGLRMSVNGAFLRDQCDLRSVATSPLLSVYSEDLGRQVGWNTVFLAQYVGPLLIYLVFYLRLSSVYDDATKRRRHQVVDLACFCHSLHYMKHLLEILFVHSVSDGCTPLGSLLKVCAFYWGFTCWLGYYINHPLYTPPYFSGKQVIPSLVCFLVCECGNLCIHISLARHRQTGNELTHPTSTSNPFTWLFTLVHCPQYTYEIGAWLALSIMTQTVPVAVFASLLTVQMLLWARRRQGRYLRQVKNARRFWRTAVIPFLF